MLTEYSSWRWCRFVNVPIAVAAALAALPTVRESRADGARRYDVPGAVLVTGGLVALVYAFTQAAKPGAGWLAAPTLALLAAAAVLLAAFVVVEARTAHPLLPLRVVLDRNRGGALLTSLLLSCGMFAMFLFLAYYYQVSLGYQPLRSGLAFLPFSGGIIVTASLASTLLPRVGPKPLLVTGMALGTAGMFWLTRLDGSSTWLSGVLPALVVMSVGLGLVFVPLSGVALFGIAPHDAGVASAMLNEHLTADRRRAGSGAAEHAVRIRGHQLRPRTHPGPAAHRRCGSRAFCTATGPRSPPAAACSPRPCS